MLARYRCYAMPCVGRSIKQWRRNYGDRGVHCTAQVQDLYPLYPQVKDAAYVKILSKRL